MTFVQDNKTAASLGQENRTAAATLTQDNRNGGFSGFSWGSDFSTWANETRTWGQMILNPALDTRSP